MSTLFVSLLTVIGGIFALRTKADEARVTRIDLRQDAATNSLKEYATRLEVRLAAVEADMQRCHAERDSLREQMVLLIAKGKS